MRPDKPQIEQATAELWAQRLYGDVVVARPLPGDIDRNFLLENANGVRSVLKIAPAQTDPTAVDCPLAILDHLRSSPLSEMVPVVLRDQNGERLSKIIDENGATLLVRRVSYLDGVPLSTTTADEGLLREIGQILGQLDLALNCFDHPGAHIGHTWDLLRLPDLQPNLDALGSEIRPAVESAMSRYLQKVEPRLSGLPRSVIHNDANDYNVLVNVRSSGETRLSGLIDFGDALHTVTIAELAIGCAYAMLDSNDPERNARAMTAGYESARPLSSLELELLPDLIEARLCASLLHSAQARRFAPDDEYLTISERPAKALLLRLQSEAP